MDDEVTRLCAAAPSQEQQCGLLGQEPQRVTRHSKDGTPGHRDLLVLSTEGRGPGVGARAEPHVVLCCLEQRVPGALRGKATGALGQGKSRISLCRIARPVLLSDVSWSLRLVSVFSPAQRGEWGGLLFWQSSRKSCQWLTDHRLTDHRLTDHRMNDAEWQVCHGRCDNVRVLSLALRGVLENPKKNCQSTAFLCNHCSFAPARLSPAPNSLTSPWELRTFIPPFTNCALPKPLSLPPLPPLAGLPSSSQKDAIQLVSKGYTSTHIRHQSIKQIPRHAASKDWSTLQSLPLQEDTSKSSPTFSGFLLNPGT